MWSYDHLIASLPPATISYVLFPQVESRNSHIRLSSEAKRLARVSPKTGKRRSLREIVAELAALWHLHANGKPYGAK